MLALSGSKYLFLDEQSLFRQRVYNVLSFLTDRAFFSDQCCIYILNAFIFYQFCSRPENQYVHFLDSRQYARLPKNSIIKKNIYINNLHFNYLLNTYMYSISTFMYMYYY